MFKFKNEEVEVDINEKKIEKTRLICTATLLRFFKFLAIFIREECNKQNACRAFLRKEKLRMSCRNADAEGSCRKPRSSIFMRTGEASVNYPGTFVQHMFLPDSERTGFLP